MFESKFSQNMNENFFATPPNSFPTKSFKNTVYDIDFEKQRSRRALELRRSSPIGFQRSKTYNSKLSESLNPFGTSKIMLGLNLRLDKHSHNFSDDSKELSNDDFFEKAAAIIRSNDDQQINQFVSTFSEYLNGNEIKAHYLFDCIIGSKEFIDIIIDAINNTDCDSFNDGIHAEKVKKTLFDVISLIYPLQCQEMRDYFIDEGICFTILNMLSSENGNDLLNNFHILAQVHNTQGQIRIDDSLAESSFIEDTYSNENHLISTLQLHASTFNLISKLVEPSTYARDSILSLGIHEIIADIIVGISQFLEADTQLDSEFHENVDELLLLSSYCLESIFENLNDIDRKAVFDFIPRFILLLRIPNLKVSLNIIQILLYIVKKFPSTVYMLFDIEDGEIKEHILRLLIGDFESFGSNSEFDVETYIEENEELIEITLKFLGNLCCAKPSEVISLYSVGICDILHVLMNTPKLITEVLWVLSNMYKVITDQMIDEISADFISEIVRYSTNCNYDCKRETGYFLATIILYSPQQITQSLIVQEIIDIVVEVLGCGIPDIVKRSANAIARLVHFATTTNEFEPLLSFLEASDLKGRLCELLDDDKISVWLDNSVGLDEFYEIICELFESNQ